MNTVLAPPAPRWSVVVPTFNRPEALRCALAALDRLVAPEGGHEIVVVDDGGTADLGFVADHPQVRLLRQANAGPAAARNAGAAAARGRFLAFTDDDCCPRPDWLVRLAEPLESAPERFVGGVAVNGFTDNRFSAASQMLVDAFTAWENRGTTPRFFASNNIALARDAFLAVGGFDAAFPLAAGEDRAFCEAWGASGRPLVFAPNAVVDHFHDLDLARFWRQQANYGRGAHRLRGHVRADAPGGKAATRLAFTAHLLRTPWRTRVGSAAVLTSLLALSQAATAWGFACEAIGAGRRTATYRSETSGMRNSER